jgi:choline dehydrogenase-like flavoprotein
LSIAVERQATAHEGIQSVGLRTCVGGMGSIWSGAVPRPRRWEVPDLIPWPEMARRLGTAERLLGVKEMPSVPEPAAVHDVRARLAFFAAHEGRLERPRRLPMAEVRRGGRSVPTATATILAAGHSIVLRDLSVCRQLVVDDAGRVRSAEIVDLASGASFITKVRSVAVAGNAFRTPQLLWVSGIRPATLGRYLHEHPMINARGWLPRTTSARRRPGLAVEVDVHGAADGRTWLPSGDAGRHAHGQVLHLPAPAGTADAHTGSAVVLSWYVSQEVEQGNRLDFGAGLEDDQFGMRVPRVAYHRSARDHARVAAAAAEMQRLNGAGLIEFCPDGAPTAAVRGLSRHFLGTTRMGRTPSDSVCDETGRVWGHPNLFVCGTGVIGWPTSCNPTLTAVAHAFRTAEEIIQLLAI